jgi:hypothetical protein
MPEPKTYKIEITNRRSSFRRWVQTMVFTAITVIAPISIGVWVGSTAMQWLGFLFAFMLLLAIGMKSVEKDTRKVHTFAEARRAIDEMEAAEDAGH